MTPFQSPTNGGIATRTEGGEAEGDDEDVEYRLWCLLNEKECKKVEKEKQKQKEKAEKEVSDLISLFHYVIARLNSAAFMPHEERTCTQISFHLLIDACLFIISIPSNLHLSAIIQNKRLQRRKRAAAAVGSFFFIRTHR